MARGKKIEIEAHYTAAELRAEVKGDLPALTAKRMLALANVLDGMTNTDAGAAVGLERQAVGDAIKRYNVEKLDGLYDRERPGRPKKLTDVQEQELKAEILKGPDPEKDGISAYTLDDLCALAAKRFKQTYTDRGMSGVVKRLGMSRQKARPHHPEKDDAAQAAFKRAPRQAENGW